jgi:hypothetical protein
LLSIIIVRELFIVNINIFIICIRLDNIYCVVNINLSLLGRWRHTLLKLINKIYHTSSTWFVT